jgi:hypothetical protein
MSSGAMLRYSQRRPPAVPRLAGGSAVENERSAFRPPKGGKRNDQIIAKGCPGEHFTK